jgi:hypothetical protein
MLEMDEPISLSIPPPSSPEVDETDVRIGLCGCLFGCIVRFSFVFSIDNHYCCVYAFFVNLFVILFYFILFHIVGLIDRFIDFHRKLKL